MSRSPTDRTRGRVGWGDKNMAPASRKRPGTVVTTALDGGNVRHATRSPIPRHESLGR